MGIVREIKVRAGQIAGPVVGMTVVVYFAYHAVQGDRGVIALGKLRQDVGVLQAQVLDVRAERMSMQKKVTDLSPGSIDADLLEERARVLLGYGFESEAVIFTTPSSPSQTLSQQSLPPLITPNSKK